MFRFIKKLFKPKQQEHKKHYSTPQGVAHIYFQFLEYGEKIDVDYFCNDLRFSEEEIAEVHKIIKERLLKKKMKAIERDFT